MTKDKLLGKFINVKGTGMGITVPKDYKFKTSWDWLMLVVEKIESIGYQVDIISRLLPFFDVGQKQTNEKDHTCLIWNDKHTEKIVETTSDKSKINACYLGVFGFVEWYYKNQEEKDDS